MSLKDLPYKARESSTKIIMDDTLRQAIDDAAEAYGRQKALEAQDGQGLGSELPELEQRLADAMKAADQSAVLFRFRALPRPKIEELVRQFPPTQAELDRWQMQARAQPLVAKPPPQFDWYEFAPRVIARSMVEPDTTVEEVLELWNDDSENGWSDAIWEELWETAWSVNQVVSTRPTYGNDSEKT